MGKLKTVVYCPVDCYSGYSSRSRDLIKAMIDLKQDEWDIKIISCRWGNTPLGFIDDNMDEWGFLKPYILKQNLNYQPDIMFWITIPSEAQRVGKWNCLITAGIETTICDPSWIEGINRMDLTLVSSEHAKKVFMETKFEKRDQTTNQLIGTIQVEKTIEVLHEGANLDIYKPIEPKDITNINLDNVKESFTFLFLGHWIGNADIGEDRKNVGLLVKAFYETFKNKKNKPALILKTSGAGSSYTDRNKILDKIDQIKNTVGSKDLPNVYLFHGDVSDQEINELYNHPKVKAMISLTKGEGFGRPLLEFSLVKKPIITSNWSGHLDFLKPEFTLLIPGTLKNVHASAVVPNIILAESQWFAPDHGYVGSYMVEVFENYKDYKEKANRQAYYSKTNFSWDKMKEKMCDIFTRNIPDLPKPIELKLPSVIKLPKKELIINNG